jgi:Tfp pilus assembly protein PilN
MKAQQLTLWLLGAMLVLVSVLGGSVLATNNSRFDRLEARVDRIETKIDTVTQQYGLITVLEERTRTMQKLLEIIFADLRSP